MILVLGSYDPSPNEVKGLYSYMSDNKTEEYLVGDSKGIEQTTYSFAQVLDVSVHRQLTNWNLPNAHSVKYQNLVDCLLEHKTKSVLTVGYLSVTAELALMKAIVGKANHIKIGESVSA